MKAFLRWMFTAVSALSLLVFIATVVIWVRSYFVGDTWIWYDRDCSECMNILRFGRGRVRYAWADYSRLSGINPAPGYHSLSIEADSMSRPVAGDIADTKFLGLHYARYSSPSLLLDVLLVLPLVISALAPLAWVWSWLRRRRWPPGLCSRCGYDLRASGYRCPECGTARETP